MSFPWSITSRHGARSASDDRLEWSRVASVSRRQCGTAPDRRATVLGGGGFSLIEVMLVVALIMTMAAISIPSVLDAVAHSKLRGASSSLAGLIQNGRMQAVKRNKTLTLHFVTKANVPFAVVSDAASASLDPSGGASEVQLGGSTFKVAVPSAGEAPPLTEALLSFTPLNLPDTISFSPRGLPCKYASGVCTTAGFVYYVTDTSRRNAWTAVSISPGGRVKQWIWSGKAWAD